MARSSPLRSAVSGVAEHLAHALLDDASVLGDPAVVWAELADAVSGAVGWLLEAIGARTPRAVDGVPLLPAAAGRGGCGGGAVAGRACGRPPGGIAGWRGRGRRGGGVGPDVLRCFSLQYVVRCDTLKGRGFGGG